MTASLVAQSRPVLNEFKKALLKRFQGTDEGPVEQYLGCQRIRDRPHRVSKLVQTAYFERLLKTFECGASRHKSSAEDRQ
jgi:hypothetical protein